MNACIMNMQVLLQKELCVACTTDPTTVAIQAIWLKLMSVLPRSCLQNFNIAASAVLFLPLGMCLCIVICKQYESD